MTIETPVIYVLFKSNLYNSRRGFMLAYAATDIPVPVPASTDLPTARSADTANWRLPYSSGNRQLAMKNHQPITTRPPTNQPNITKNHSATEQDQPTIATDQPLNTRNRLATTSPPRTATQRRQAAAASTSPNATTEPSQSKLSLIRYLYWPFTIQYCF